MLFLSRKIEEEIVRHSREESPNEACGILAGPVMCGAASGQDESGREVTKVYRMTNTDRSSKTFLMDPKEQLRVMKEMRISGLEMVGVYHSHPESAAYPSTRDVEMAFYSDISYVIISLKDEMVDIRSFRISNGSVAEEEIKTQHGGADR